MSCFMDRKLSTLPEYDKTYDLEAAKRLDNQVMHGDEKSLVIMTKLFVDRYHYL